MSYYAVPVYVGISTLLCSLYCCIESMKGKLDNTVKSILCSWCVMSIIITSIIGGIAGEMTMGIAPMSHVLIMMILFCVTLSISSSMIYWT